MRKIILAMMATLNGRLDHPEAWMTGVDDDLYRDIEQGFERDFDSVLVGRTTYNEMSAYWPGAEIGELGPEPDSEVMSSVRASQITRDMAVKMNSYKKFVVSRNAATESLSWNNSELVSAPSDTELVRFVGELKSRPGRNVQLAGGAQLAQSFVRLGLIDECHLYVQPVLSPGATLFDHLDGQQPLELCETKSYTGGVVALRYRTRPG
jgi:dihydrofolate reductase